MPDNNPVPPSGNGPKKPLNPQLETVLMNQPVRAQNVVAPQVGANSSKPKPPQKIGREKSVASRRRFLLGCFGGFIFLFILFVVLMVLMISRTGGSNSIIANFGLDAAGVRAFLQGIVGFVFGLFSIFFLVLAVIGLFRFLGAQKLDKEKRQHNLRLSLFSTLALIFLVFIWVILGMFINRMQINIASASAEILVLQPADLTDLQAPVEIRFSALNIATALNQTGAQIERLDWDLDGDGEFETPVNRGQPEVTRIYRQTGTYNVGLRAKILGEEAFRTPYTKQIVIGTAVFEADPSTGAPPLTVEFDASNIIGEREMSSLDWDFNGDGTFDLEGPDNMTATYTFEKIGSYNVLLRAIDASGNLERFTREIEVTASDTPLVSARIEATPGLSGPAPFQVRFDGGDSSSLRGQIQQYEWDFGDGSALELGRSVSHTFPEPGPYTVTLKVQDDLDNQGQTSVEVEALGASTIPEAVITTLPALEPEAVSLNGTLPFKVTFDASKSLDIDDDIVQYEWDFNADGRLDAQGVKTEYTFEKAGNYNVQLRVEDAQQHETTTTLLVVVQEPGVQAIIKATPQEGTAPLSVLFDGSSSTAFNGNISSYEWDFGDGSPKSITAAEVTHKYNLVGTYNVTLKVMTNQNESATSTTQIFVREVALKACFTPSRTMGAAPLTVKFDSTCSTGAIKAYLWQYGDGEESENVSPTHTFENPGTYTVNLEIVDDKNNVNTIQEVIEVQ